MKICWFPFINHGISEIIVDGKVLDENVPFNKLVSDERVKHILHYSDFYGYDGSRLRALVFCSHVQEAEELAKKFNEIGRKAQALNGNSSEKERKEAIERLESEKIAADKQLEFIFTVDIFNEGIDIPSLNQIIMLRPTKSAIIFVQQLGRGLRKCEHKRYLEVLDFIGNYENNFLLPIALYGDRSYNRDHLRKIIHNNFLPGASTVHFEDIVEKRIFESINNSKITAFSEYKKSYNLVKFKIGRTPMMMDFVKLGDKDPYVFVQKARSYYNFKQRVDFSETTITKLQEQVLQFLNLEICNGKRLEEIVILKNLLAQKAVTAEELINIMYAQYGVASNFKNILGAVNLLNQKFFKAGDRKKYGELSLVSMQQDTICLTKEFQDILIEKEFSCSLKDALAYAEYKFMENYDADSYEYGFKLYETYSRKDVLRILNWPNDESSTVYGYRVKYSACPIFVTYKKNNNISNSTKYEDCFINRKIFSWMTRSRLNLESREVAEIKKPETIKYLFIKKSDADGSDFYYLGKLDVKEMIQTTIDNDAGIKLSIVNILFNMQSIVEENIYKYLES